MLFTIYLTVGLIAASANARRLVWQDDETDKESSNHHFKPPSLVIPPFPVWQPVFPLPFMTLGSESQSMDKPGENNHFQSSSTTSYSSSSQKNGVSTMKGGANIKRNVNGKVDEQTIIFGDSEV